VNDSMQWVEAQAGGLGIRVNVKPALAVQQQDNHALDHKQRH
jgi:hypothetical protein